MPERRSGPKGHAAALACRGLPACESLLEGRNRNVRGVADLLDEEKRLANRISDRISPCLVAELEILPWWQTQVLALRIYPSPSRPHHLIRESPAAGIDVRVGSTNRRADAELIEEIACRRAWRGGA